MAKGKRCPACNDVMYAQDEKHYPKGTEVTYVCRNGNCKTVQRGGHPEMLKVFEEN